MKTGPVCGLLVLVVAAACENHGSPNGQVTSPSATAKAGTHSEIVPAGIWTVSGTVSDLNAPSRA